MILYLIISNYRQYILKQAPLKPMDAGRPAQLVKCLPRGRVRGFMMMMASTSGEDIMSVCAYLEKALHISFTPCTQLKGKGW